MKIRGFSFFLAEFPAISRFLPGSISFPSDSRFSRSLDTLCSKQSDWSNVDPSKKLSFNKEYKVQKQIFIYLEPDGTKYTHWPNSKVKYNKYKKKNECSARSFLYSLSETSLFQYFKRERFLTQTEICFCLRKYMFKSTKTSFYRKMQFRRLRHGQE